MKHFKIYYIRFHDSELINDIFYITFPSYNHFKYQSLLEDRIIIQIHQHIKNNLFYFIDLMNEINNK